MTIGEILESEFDNLENFLLTFNFGVQEVQSNVFDMILKLIAKLPQKDGKLQYEDKVKQLILKFEDHVIEELGKGKYSKNVNQILINFDRIEKIRKDVNEYLTPSERLKIFKADLDSVKKGYIQKISESLGSKEALGLNYVTPIKNLLFEHAALGLSVADATNKLFNIAMSKEPGGGLLGSYAGQVARDSLFSFTGSVDQEIGEFIGAKDVNYLGSIIEDSRPQCVRWVVKYKGFIPAKDVSKEIAWANKNGKGYSDHLPKLTKQTFAIVRGGHNCRHRVIWTNGLADRTKIEAIENKYKKLNEEFRKKAEKNLTGKTKELYDAARAKVDLLTKLYGN